MLCILIDTVLSARMIYYLQKIAYVFSVTTWARKFWEINYNLSKTVQDKDIVAMED